MSLTTLQTPVPCKFCSQLHPCPCYNNQPLIARRPSRALGPHSHQLGQFGDPCDQRRWSACVSWNRGRCTFPACNSRHICATCKKRGRRARDCEETPAESGYKSLPPAVSPTQEALSRAGISIHGRPPGPRSDSNWLCSAVLYPSNTTALHSLAKGTGGAPRQSICGLYSGADLEPEVEGGPMLAACAQRGKGAGGGGVSPLPRSAEAGLRAMRPPQIGGSLLVSKQLVVVGATSDELGGRGITHMQLRSHCSA